MGEKTRKRSRRRLPDYDYRSPGAYFVTVCTHQRVPILGEVVGGKMALSPTGRIVEQEWLRSQPIRAEIRLDEFVIMPNHLHGIVFIFPTNMESSSVGATGRSPLPRSGPAPGSLGALIGGFKSSATKRIRQETGQSNLMVWQRNYYERVIRQQSELDNVRRYIRTNPIRWQEDRFFPWLK